MEYWIDGYNLILRQAWNESGSLESARDRLIRETVRLGAPVRIYFDASRSQGLSGEGPSPDRRITVLYSRDGIADDAMIRDLAKAQASAVTLVTDDRELRARARDRGANTLGVERFLSKLAKAAAPKPKGGTKAPGSGKLDAEGRPKKISKKEVDDWLDAFGFDDDDLVDPMLR